MGHGRPVWSGPGAEVSQLMSSGSWPQQGQARWIEQTCRAGGRAIDVRLCGEEEGGDMCVLR